MKTLDPLRIPLRGLHLIEASAGTGKTYAIATIYLRLLLDGLPVDRILVVTYTNAATEELRERIRRRVVEALDLLEGGGAAGDAILLGLLGGLADGERARALLAEAVTRLDEAAVYTIHGFCGRALQDNAFESGAPFEAELLTEEQTLRRGVSEDFWRRRVGTLEEEDAAWVRGRWSSPGALLAAIGEGLSRDDLRLVPEDAEAKLAAYRRQGEALFAWMRDLWGRERGQVVELLERSGALKPQSYTKVIVARAVAQMDALLSAPALAADLPPDFDRFTPARLAASAKPGAAPPAHPFFDLCGGLPDLIARIESYRRAAFLTAARDDCRTELERRKEAARQFFFDDLLRRLDQALGARGGKALAACLRERYPVALIDEFQDTDPLQYRIFRRIYGERPECGLYLIGDPKQAIYAFRGADIFTYIQASREAAREGERHTLGTNWRSASALVAAVNRLFDRSPAPFVYTEDIPFLPVAPGPEADAKPLTVAGERPAPLQFWLLPITERNTTGRGRIKAGDAKDLAARACAERIAELLVLADKGQALIGRDRLQSGDIAVLVRTHREGAQVQTALSRCGVASVTLNQDSVFATDEARELALVLAAVADAADEALLRGALATGLLGTPVSRLASLSADESAWEALLGRFQGYRERWRTHGFMNAFQALLRGEQVAVRLREYPDGERRLTNLLQLAELLQVAERTHPGPDGLLRWLADRRADPPAGDESEQLRLESDEGLVRIVTLHKSKGLEYPVVFLPFPWTTFRARGGDCVFYHDPVDLAACLDLGSPDLESHRTLADTEELAQRLRLFYVAVTRAKHLCVLCWGPVNEAEMSAPAWLLHPDLDSSVPASRLRDLDAAGVRSDLEGLVREGGGHIRVDDLPAPRDIRWSSGRRVAAASLRAARFTAEIPRDWRLASYSWLASGAESERPDHDAAQAGEPEPLAAEPAKIDPIFRFPRGTEAGHFLHSVFEQLDFPAADAEALGAVAGRLLARYGLDPLWEPVVAQSVGHVLDTPLDAGEGLRLRNLTLKERLNELEFHFPLARLDPRALRQCLAGFDGYRPAAEGLAFEPVRGLMKGYIDLVFRSQGRYYLADYKSNHLGDRLEDYGKVGLRRAMCAHNYDLQYLIYTLALHRHLRQRVPNYRYEDHFGGVYYLFLRGMRPATGPRFGVFFDRPPAALVAGLDGLFAGDRV